MFEAIVDNNGVIVKFHTRFCTKATFNPLFQRSTIGNRKYFVNAPTRNVTFEKITNIYAIKNCIGFILLFPVLSFFLQIFF